MRGWIAVTLASVHVLLAPATSHANIAPRSLGAVRLGPAPLGLRAISRPTRLSLAGLLVALAVVGCSTNTTGTFSRTGSMATARDFHTATLLSDGRVLIAGGSTGQADLASAELYDPKTGTFTATGSMITARLGPTATLLENGSVLIAGGRGGWPGPAPAELASAELYDPKTGTFSPTGSMTAARNRYHTATLLSDGRVLIVGGVSGIDNPSWGSAELYDPKTGKFSRTGSSTAAEGSHTATRLSDGRVLIAAGGSMNDLYDPTTGTFNAIGFISDASRPTATLLSDGRVLLAGGEGGGITGNDNLASAELYDPKTGTSSPTGSMITARSGHTATLLSDGRVLIVGDGGIRSADASAEVYDPKTGTFTATGSMSSTHREHTATLLSDGQVLIAGGGGDLGFAPAELFEP